MQGHRVWNGTQLMMAVAFLAVQLGCSDSGKSSVSGHITLKNGTPVTATKVLFRSNKTGKSARGLTNADGYYELSSLNPGDGIEPGKYYVTLQANVSTEGAPPPALFSNKYGSFTEELIFDVEAGVPNTIDMQLDPP